MTTRDIEPLYEQLGQVTVPSGVVLVVDTGLLNLWCHDRPPLLSEDAAPEDVVASENAAVDLRVEGPDAELAGRAFDRQWHPRFLFDIPAQAVQPLRERFEALVRERGWVARLVTLDRRVPHRERVDLALEHGRGAGEVTSPRGLIPSAAFHHQPRPEGDEYRARYGFDGALYPWAGEKRAQPAKEQCDQRQPDYTQEEVNARQEH
jgi:hypothetical protein